jgi:hydroxymethylglutaryl-CoA synthase
MALTVVHSLLEKYDVHPSSVGRCEVGTETLIDKSKSTKTVLMDLFGDNTDVEGATVINACYGGTAALLNAFCWCESSAWDGRYAIVVAVDIATYARGPARPTSGAGAVAFLIGRDAPLAMVDMKERATHACNVYDFFKPDPSVEYPTVDGGLSQVCYYRALEDCYAKFCDKVDSRGFTTESADYFVFHAPYNKLVQKSFGRLVLADARREYRRKKDEEEKKLDPPDNDDKQSEVTPTLDEEYLTKPIEETYNDKTLESKLKSLSAKSYERRLSDSNAASKLVGNTYTASVFLGMASLVDRAGGRGELTPGKSVVVFSYGSGALATMYRLRVRSPTGLCGRVFRIEDMVEKMNLTERLAKREEVHPMELDLALETRARMHRSGAPYSPVYPTVGRMVPGSRKMFVGLFVGFFALLNLLTHSLVHFMQSFLKIRNVLPQRNRFQMGKNLFSHTTRFETGSTGHGRHARASHGITPRRTRCRLHTRQGHARCH